MGGPPPIFCSLEITMGGPPHILGGPPLLKFDRGGGALNYETLSEICSEQQIFSWFAINCPPLHCVYRGGPGGVHLIT